MTGENVKNGFSCPVRTSEHYCERTNHVWDSLYNFGVIQENGQILYFSFRSWSCSFTIFVLDTQGHSRQIFQSTPMHQSHNAGLGFLMNASWCQLWEYLSSLVNTHEGSSSMMGVWNKIIKNQLTHKHWSSVFLQTIPFHPQFQEARLKKKKTTFAHYSSLTCI